MNMVRLGTILYNTPVCVLSSYAADQQGYFSHSECTRRSVWGHGGCIYLREYMYRQKSCCYQHDWRWVPTLRLIVVFFPMWYQNCLESGRGKSLVVEANLKKDVLASVLKTTAEKIVFEDIFLKNFVVNLSWDFDLFLFALVDRSQHSEKSNRFSSCRFSTAFNTYRHFSD